MNSSRYIDITAQKMDLRDLLALERTNMANERTILAYMRTMVGIIAVGGTVLKVFTGVFFTTLAWILIIFGILLFVFGFSRYIKLETMLAKIK